MIKIIVIAVALCAIVHSKDCSYWDNNGNYVSCYQNDYNNLNGDAQNYPTNQLSNDYPNYDDGYKNRSDIRRAYRKG